MVSRTAIEKFRIFIRIIEKDNEYYIIEHIPFRLVIAESVVSHA